MCFLPRRSSLTIRTLAFAVLLLLDTQDVAQAQEHSRYLIRLQYRFFAGASQIPIDEILGHGVLIGPRGPVLTARHVLCPPASQIFPLANSALLTIERWDHVSSSWRFLDELGAEAIGDRLLSREACPLLDWGMPSAETSSAADDLAFLKVSLAQDQPFLELAGPLDGPPSFLPISVLTVREGYPTRVPVHCETHRDDVHAVSHVPLFRPGVSGSPVLESAGNTDYVVGVSSRQAQPLDAVDTPPEGTLRASIATLRSLQFISPAALLRVLPRSDDFLSRLCQLASTVPESPNAPVPLLTAAAIAAQSPELSASFLRLLLELRLSPLWRSTAEVLAYQSQFSQRLASLSRQLPSIPTGGIFHPSVPVDQKYAVLDAAAGIRTRLSAPDFASYMNAIGSPGSPGTSPKAKQLLGHSMAGISKALLEVH